MKKTLITLMAMAGVASAEYSITTDDTFYTNPNAWVYVWTGAGAEGNWNDGSNWVIYTGKNDDTAETQADYKPVNADPAIIGYTFSYVDGKQVLTANDTAITVNTVSWMGNNNRFYIGHNVTLQGKSNGFSGGQTVTFNFGDFGGTSVISMGDFWMQGNATVNFTGEVTMTGNDFSYTLFTATNMAQNSGIWNASGVSVIDAKGNILTYTTDEDKIGTAGYYWLESTYAGQGTANSVMLVAKAIPEPTTATLSLLALAGLAARRRRR